MTIKIINFFIINNINTVLSISDKEYTECCLNGNLEHVRELQNDVTFVTYTKQCIEVIKNGHYDIIEYLVNLPLRVLKKSLILL